MNKKLRIALLIFLVIGIILILVYVNIPRENSESGYLTLIVKNIDNDVVEQKRLKYEKEDSAFDVLNKNYDLEYKEDAYGNFLLGFNDFDIHTDGLSKWLWIEVGYLKDGAEYNDIINFEDYDITKSNIGIDGIELENNMILGICERDNDHETSILDVDDSKNISEILNIIGYIIIGAGLVLFVVLLIVDKDKKPMKVKDICIMGLFTAILFVQEQLLVFLPNIQLTFLLIVLYTIVFGVKKTLMITFVHVLLDNMIMGSFTFITMIPMLIGYTSVVFLTNLAKNKSLPMLVLSGCIGALIYCFMFVFMNKIVYDIDIMAYLIADIPFELLLILSTILTISYLLRPLEKLLNSLLNNESE